MTEIDEGTPEPPALPNRWQDDPEAVELMTHYAALPHDIRPIARLILRRAYEDTQNGKSGDEIRESLAEGWYVVDHYRERR